MMAINFKPMHHTLLELVESAKKTREPLKSKKEKSENKGKLKNKSKKIGKKKKVF